MVTNKQRILFITTMYPDPFRPGTKVCHYFTREWKEMGHEVLVINLRSLFPRVFTDLARLFPKLAYRYVGNHVEMDRNKSIIEHEVDGICVFSIPIFKFIPHRRYPSSSIVKTVNCIKRVLEEKNYIPDLIMGHFFNPTIEIVTKLKEVFVSAKCSVVLHEGPAGMIKIYGKNAKSLLNSFDILGFRNNSLRNIWINALGPFRHTFICYSGTPSSYLCRTVQKDFRFEKPELDRFIYVGQFTKNKSVKESIEALHHAYPMGGFQFTCIGDGGTAMPEIEMYIEKEGLRENIRFTGRLQREKIMDFYDENECFIMISKSEAFGLVYLEAMARGCICVGTRGQGIDGVIKDGVNGFLCRGGDSYELSQIIRRINNLSIEERKGISINARATAARFSDKNVAEYYLESVVNS